MSTKLWVDGSPHFSLCVLISLDPQPNFKGEVVEVRRYPQRPKLFSPFEDDTPCPIRANRNIPIGLGARRDTDSEPRPQVSFPILGPRNRNPRRFFSASLFGWRSRVRKPGRYVIW